MNLLKLSFLLVAIVALSACNKDDDSSDCVQADWVGTYTGVEDCQGITDSITITIVASGSDITVSTDGTSLYGTMSLDGCEAKLDNSVGGAGQIYEAELNGTSLTLKDIVDVPIVGSSTICTVTATKN